MLNRRNNNKIIHFLLLFLLLFWPLTGCLTSHDAPNENTHSPKFVSQGIITAISTRYIESSIDEHLEQFEIVAVFPKYDLNKRAIVDSFLGTRMPQSDLVLDTCSQPEPVFSTKERRIFAGDLAIKLVDVGDVAVTYDNKLHPMPTRTFPDLLKVIDGVIYTATQRRKVHFIPGETYTVSASGTDEVSSFDVILDAPSDLGDVKIYGISLFDQVPILKRGKNLELSWEGEGYGDEIIAEINWSSLGLSWVMTCRMKDDGFFIIPREITNVMHDRLTGSDHEMSLSRVRQVSFRSKGLSNGDFSFVATTNFLIRFEQGIEPF